jgi:hypothetical protein
VSNETNKDEPATLTVTFLKNHRQYGKDDVASFRTPIARQLIKEGYATMAGEKKDDGAKKPEGKQAPSGPVNRQTVVPRR